ncbi:MAG: oligoendopeptidase [Acidimicrobiaceae bacterium]|nr:oligoendopeptidase [Acidimicrobiaceae bacterium]
MEELPAWRWEAAGVDLTGLPAEAHAFARRWRHLRWAAASRWARACREAEAVLTPLADLETQVEVLRASGATADADALAGRLVAAQVAAGAMMSGFEGAWLALWPRWRRRLLARPALAPYRHHLSRLWAGGDREAGGGAEAGAAAAATEDLVGLTLGPASEVNAWLAAFERTTVAPLVDLGRAPVSLAEAARHLGAVDGGERRRAGEAISAALAEEDGVLATAYTGLVQSAARNGRRQGRPGWLADIHLANGTTDAEVDALVAAVGDDHAFVARLYQLKGDLIGAMTAWDRQAPLGPVLDLPERTYSWREATGLVLEAFAAFAPELAAAATSCLDRGFVDATARAGKRTGAFTIPAPSGRWAFVSIPFGGTLDDVALLAHELGHAAHASLSQGCGLFSCLAAVPVAEAVALLCEQLVVERLLAGAVSAEERLAMLVWRCEWTVASVHRQIAIHQFEAGIHQAAWAGEPVSAGAVADRFMATQRILYGDSVVLPDGFRHWWVQVSHLFRSPGYVHTYAYGGLAALVAIADWRADPEDAAARWLALMAAGGSAPTGVLLAAAGADPADPEVWTRGLRVAGAALREAEVLVASRMLPARGGVRSVLQDHGPGIHDQD